MAPAPLPLTDNDEEERGSTWSPNGDEILYMCRFGGGAATFEICVMDADGTNVRRLTNNTLPDLTPTWSPDGQKIVFHRPVARIPQLFIMNADGSRQTRLTPVDELDRFNLLANWGELRVHVKP